NTEIGDAGLAHLSALPKLTVLRLQGTGVTDAGLGQLKKMTTLASLYLDGTRVTEAGVAELKKSLPRCFVSAQPPKPEPDLKTIEPPIKPGDLKPADPAAMVKRMG